MNEINVFKTVCVATTKYYWEYTPKPFLMKRDNQPIELTDETIKQHIEGKKVLGLPPFVDNNNVLYGGLDIDCHKPTEAALKIQLDEFKGDVDKLKIWSDDFVSESRKCLKEDVPKLTNELDRLGYLYFLNSSGSEGIHLRVYSNSPLNGKVMRYFLLDLQERILGEIRHEVFPKQNELNEETPFGNQMKAPLAIHPKTGNLAGIIKDSKILNRQESLDFFVGFWERISSTKKIEFEVTEQIEHKFESKAVHYSTEEADIKNAAKLPSYCDGIETVACLLPLPSGTYTRHQYLDGSAYAYLKDKPELFKNYKKMQGRDSTAFNSSDKWTWDCRTIFKYLSGNKGKGIELWKSKCKKCIYFQKNIDDSLKALEESKDDNDKQLRILEETLKNVDNKNIIKFEDTLKEISLITGRSYTTLEKRFNQIKKEEIIVQKDLRKIENEERLAQTEGLTNTILTLLLQKDKGQATELLVKDLLENNHIYTTRDDKLSEVWIYKNGIYIPQGRTYIQERCREILGETYTTNLSNQVVSKIEADTFIEQEEFFNKEYPNLIVVKNGILDIIKKSLIPFNPKYIFFNKIPIKYDLEAKCEKIDKFLNSILDSQEDIEVLRESFGFLLYDDYFLEKAVMLYGNGRNGKGKLIGLMKSFLGIDNCVEISLDHLEDDLFSMGELFKMKANLCGDISRTALKNSGNFKKLIGRDLIAAPRKFKTRVKFVNTAKMIFSANELPITYDISNAFWERWVIIDFPYTFLPQTEIEQLPEKERDNVKVQDPNILDKISTPEELSGLLNVALIGLKKIMNKNQFSKSQGAEEIKRRWIRRSDSCAAFVMDFIEQDFDEGIITKSDFRKYYSKYCSLHKLRHASDKGIKYILNTQVGAIEDRINIDDKQKYCWVGIKFKYDEEELKTMFSQDNYHISPYSKIVKTDIGSNKVATLTSIIKPLSGDLSDFGNQSVVAPNNGSIKQEIRDTIKDLGVLDFKKLKQLFPNNIIELEEILKEEFNIDK